MTLIEYSDRRRLVRSGFFSLGLWIVIGLAFFLVPVETAVKKAEHFNSVHLTLAPAGSPVSGSSLEKTKLATSGAAGGVAGSVAPGTAAKASGGKSAAKAPAAAGSSSVQKSGSSVKASSPSVLPRSSGGLGIPNFSTPLSSSHEPAGSGDSLAFSGSGDSARQSVLQAPKGANPVVEMEGSAASVASSSSRSSGKVVPGGSRTSSSVSGETQAVLGEIAGSANGRALAGSRSGTGSGVGSANGTGSSGTAASGKAGSGNSGSGSAGNTGIAGNGGGRSGGGGPISGFAFDGVPRKLLYPSDPKIMLPQNLASLVDSNRSVTVTFTVLANGTVPSGPISFTPSAVLPAEIRDYLRKEFSSWRFEKSSEDGQARFLYSIKVE